jgi:three-Cys-motif partner protein
VSFDDVVRRCSEDDDLYLPEIKPHSLQKIGIHNRYADVFATAVRTKWPQRAYVGLYAGAGRARLKTTREIVETSALSVLRQRHPFTHHIFVDHEERCIEALGQRVAALGRNQNCQFIHGDVNSSTAAIRAAFPPFSRENGLLSFCFIDPFDIKLKFSTIRALSDRRMDFLVLLMLGIDARRNLRAYLDDESSTVVADFIDCADWRQQFRAQRQSILVFLASKFDEAMESLGYLPPSDACRVVIKPTGKNVPLYVLAFYSKHPLGQKLWKAALGSISAQAELELDT